MKISKVFLLLLITMTAALFKASDIKLDFTGLTQSQKTILQDITDANIILYRVSSMLVRQDVPLSNVLEAFKKTYSNDYCAGKILHSLLKEQHELLDEYVIAFLNSLNRSILIDQIERHYQSARVALIFKSIVDGDNAFLINQLNDLKSKGVAIKDFVNKIYWPKGLRSYRTMLQFAFDCQNLEAACILFEKGAIYKDEQATEKLMKAKNYREKFRRLISRYNAQYVEMKYTICLKSSN